MTLLSETDGCGWWHLGDAFGPGSRASRRANLRCPAPPGFDPYRKERGMKAGLQQFYEAAARTQVERRFINGEGYRFFVKADGVDIGSAKTRARAERTRKAWVKDEADRLALKVTA